MHEAIPLEKLNVSELHILLGHVQLGMSHLRKHLNDEQLTELLDQGWIKPAQFQKIKSDEVEKHGNITLMVNTVFTCVIGGWLASISFMGMSPASSEYLLLFIFIGAVISSGYFGYISFKRVRVEAKDAINKQKLANLQVKLLSIIKEKRQQTIEELIDHLNGVSGNFPDEASPQTEITNPNSLESKEEFVQWFNELNNKINAEIAPLKEERMYQIFIEGLENIKRKLEKAIDTNIGLVKHSQDGEPQQDRKANQQEWFSLDKNKDKSFITVLTDPAMAIPKAEIKKKSWLKSNIYSILNGLIPTTLGGFCSLFTYFSGIPAIAKEYGLRSWIPFWESPITRFATFFIVLAITLYFGYLFVHGNRKSFQREQEYEKTQKIITNKEAELLAITSRKNLLKKVKKYVENLLLIVSFIRHVSKIVENLPSRNRNETNELQQNS